MKQTVQKKKRKTEKRRKIEWWFWHAMDGYHAKKKPMKLLWVKNKNRTVSFFYLLASKNLNVIRWDWILSFASSNWINVKVVCFYISDWNSCFFGYCRNVKLKFLLKWIDLFYCSYLLILQSSEKKEID